MLKQIKMELLKLPAQETDRVRPGGVFVIQKIKKASRHRWGNFKFCQVQNGNCNDGDKHEGSVFLENYGKDVFKLDADVGRYINAQVYSNGMTYAREATIHCGSSSGVDGTWPEPKLTKELQVIIAKNRPYLEGLPVNRGDVEMASNYEWIYE